MDMDKMGAAMALVVKREVERATAPLLERIKGLESVQPTPGKDGQDGLPGEPGKSVSAEEVAAVVTAAYERRFGDLSLSWERQVRDMAEKAIDRMPAPRDGKDGIDGTDGLSLDSFTAVQEEGGRVVTMSLVAGDRTEHVRLHFPVVLDKGFWKEGISAEAGDGFTFGGSYWIAQKDTDTKPDIGNPDWRLAVKRGRDAKASAR